MIDVLSTRLLRLKMRLTFLLKFGWFCIWQCLVFGLSERLNQIKADDKNVCLFTGLSGYHFFENWSHSNYQNLLIWILNKNRLINRVRPQMFRSQRFLQAEKNGSGLIDCWVGVTQPYQRSYYRIWSDQELPRIVILIKIKRVYANTGIYIDLLISEFRPSLVLSLSW